MSDSSRQAHPRWADARKLAEHLGASVPTIYRQVGAGRLPPPVYVTPSAPRWDLNEVDRFLEATRARPVEAKAARRTAKLAMAG